MGRIGAREDGGMDCSVARLQERTDDPGSDESIGSGHTNWLFLLASCHAIPKVLSGKWSEKGRDQQKGEDCKDWKLWINCSIEENREIFVGFMHWGFSL